MVRTSWSTTSAGPAPRPDPDDCLHRGRDGRPRDRLHRERGGHVRGHIGHGHHPDRQRHGLGEPTPIDDNPLEPNETAVLTVAGGSGYTVGPYASSTGIITDTTTTVSVTASTAAVFQGGSATLTYTFTRAGSLAGALTVPFAVGGTAVYGTDYTETGAASFGATAGSITFAAASATASVVVTPGPGELTEPNVTVILTMFPGVGLLVGSPGSADRDDRQQPGHHDAGDVDRHLRRHRLRHRLRPDQPPLRRHGHARRAVDLHLDHHHHRPPRPPGPRILQPRRRRLVLPHQLHRRRQSRRREGARPRAVLRRLGQQGPGRDGADQRRDDGRRVEHADDLVVPVG